MPQVIVIVAPRVRGLFEDRLGESLLRALGKALMATTQSVYKVPEDDLAFTAIPALCVIGDADIQVEIRYTVGEDEYGIGEPFEPTREQMEELVDRLIAVLKNYLRDVVESLSVWVKPIRGSVFKLERV